MDPFTEKDLIENLRSIAVSLRNMDRKMDDLTTAIREFGAEMAFDSDAEDLEGEKENSEEKPAE